MGRARRGKVAAILALINRDVFIGTRNECVQRSHKNKKGAGNFEINSVLSKIENFTFFRVFYIKNKM